MPEYISDTLTHWTGRGKTGEQAFSVIKSILTNRELWLSHCPNYPNLNRHEMKPIMVCFTDIPLHLSEEHCERFGKFGVGFKKENMMSYGASPVFYTTPHLDEKIDTLISLVHDLRQYEMDRQLREGFENFQYTTEQLESLIETFGFFQNYKYRDDSVDYYQREWRIDYRSIRRATPPTQAGEGDINGSRNQQPTFNMLFNYNDIDYVIVPRNFEQECQLLLETLSLELEVKIYEDEVEK